MDLPFDGLGGATTSSEAQPSIFTFIMVARSSGNDSSSLQFENLRNRSLESRVRDTDGGPGRRDQPEGMDGE
ncbi:hypothetical protein GOBAR_AA27517 [Gossypium barbadense]|uniref:Uncharacterized protein n=1 Tax=Gossypium barbadense TaxID=3634 RepID=A0A2P5WPX0_GOSBA|nr:hypothetical protein GOBAR_AA27517 [Gossypium barbadense]